MDYLDIVKRAWRTTWRYKILWLFGLLAGAGASGGAGNGGTSTGGRTGTGTGTGSVDPAVLYQQFLRFFDRNLGIIVAVAIFLVALGVLWWVLSIAARGGIVKLVDNAEDGRPVLASEGWSAGFGSWFKVFGVSFLAGLPAAVLGLIMAGVIALAIVGAVSTGALTSWDSTALIAAVVSGLGGIWLFLLVFAVLSIAFAVVFGVVKEIGVRYAVLEGRGIMDSLRAAWSALWGKRGAFLMFVTVAVVQLVAGIALAIAAGIALLPGIVAMVLGAYVPGGVLLVVGILVLMVPAGIYGAFYHSMWTIFFRRMTGREPVAPSAPAFAGGYPPAPPAVPAGGFPAPPAAEAAPVAGAGSASAAPWDAATGVPPAPAEPTPEGS